MAEPDILELRRRVARLKEEARKNEEAWKRAQAREMELLEAGSLAVLLKHATEGLRTGYRLDAATLLLADPDHELRQLLTSQDPGIAASAAVRFADDLTGLLPYQRAAPRPWLGPYQRAQHAALFPERARLGSVALVPLLRHERLIGSLNMGSVDPGRFTRRHATDFLHHLGVIAAFALESAANRARLVRSGLTDPLTGWANRRYFEARLREEVARARRERGPLACLMIDIDHFKQVNDSHGHLAGDAVLREVAVRIGAEVRESDVAARYGGEEFVILLPGTAAPAALALAERIRSTVAANPFSLEIGKALPVTVSIGVADCRPTQRDEGSAGTDLLARADAALYEAKSRGRNLALIADQG